MPVHHDAGVSVRTRADALRLQGATSLRDPDAVELRLDFCVAAEWS